MFLQNSQINFLEITLQKYDRLLDYLQYCAAHKIKALPPTDTKQTKEEIAQALDILHGIMPELYM
jgi:hypothetical protein